MNYRIIDSQGDLVKEGSISSTNYQLVTATAYGNRLILGLATDARNLPYTLQLLDPLEGFVLQEFEITSASNGAVLFYYPHAFGYTSSSYRGDATVDFEAVVNSTSKVLSVSLQNKHGDTASHLIDPSTSNRLVLEVPLRTSDNPHFVTIAADSEICKEQISTRRGGAGSTVFKKVEVNAIYAGFSIKDNLIFAGSNEVGAVKPGSPPFAIEDAEITGVKKLGNGDFEYKFTVTTKEDITSGSSSESEESSINISITLRAGTKITQSVLSSDDILAGVEPTLGCVWN